MLLVLNSLDGVASLLVLSARALVPGLLLLACGISLLVSGAVAWGAWRGRRWAAWVGLVYCSVELIRAALRRGEGSFLSGSLDFFMNLWKPFLFASVGFLLARTLWRSRPVPPGGQVGDP